jgi:hypothetical protein
VQRATRVVERHADLVARRDEIGDSPLCHPPPPLSCRRRGRRPLSSRRS